MQLAELKKLWVCVIAFSALVWVLNGIAEGDTSLKFEFFRHRSQFEQLRKMADEDRSVIRIAMDFTWLASDSSWPRKNIGFSERRWEAYKRLFHTLGIEGGIERSQDYPFAILFIAESSGTILNEWTKGYIYSARPLSPVRHSLDDISASSVTGHSIFFEPIAENWYLFVESYN